MLTELLKGRVFFKEFFIRYYTSGLPVCTSYLFDLNVAYGRKYFKILSSFKNGYENSLSQA